MKFNRQKRVAKQLQLAKKRRVKIKCKNFETVAYAAISFFAAFASSNVKNDKLKDGLQFISALSGAMFINNLAGKDNKPIHVDTIEVIPKNVKFCAEYLPTTKTNNNESL